MRYYIKMLSTFEDTSITFCLEINRHFYNIFCIYNLLKYFGLINSYETINQCNAIFIKISNVLLLIHFHCDHYEKMFQLKRFTFLEIFILISMIQKLDDASSYLRMSLNFLVYFIISIAAYSVVKVTYIKKERLLRNSRSSRKVLRTLVCVVSVFPISLQYLQPSSAISRKRKQLLFLIKTTQRRIATLHDTHSLLTFACNAIIEGI